MSQEPVVPAALAETVEAYLRSSGPTVLAVPEIDALKYAPVAGKINNTSLPAVRDATAHLDLLKSSISVAHDHAIEIHRTATNPQLDGAESSIATPYLKAVVIRGAVHMGGPEVDHAAALGICGSEASEHQEKRQK